MAKKKKVEDGGYKILWDRYEIHEHVGPQEFAINIDYYPTFQEAKKSLTEILKDNIRYTKEDIKSLERIIKENEKDIEVYKIKLQELKRLRKPVVTSAFCADSPSGCELADEDHELVVRILNEELEALTNKGKKNGKKKK